MGKFKDNTGEKYGRLTVIEAVAGKTKDGHIKCGCVCDCGNKIIIAKADLLSGKTKSCGCLNKDFAKQRHTKHGDCGARLYSIWRNMIERCYNPKCRNFMWYGQKGIAVCAEWRFDYLNFKSWAITNGYADNLTIDRKDSKKDYTPDNCRWITREENARKSANERWERVKNIGI